MLEILKICGFVKTKNRGAIQWTDFQTWVEASFDDGTVEVTTFKRISYIKIGLGKHPKQPSSQIKEKLEPPKFRMKTVAEGKSIKDSLMLLFNKQPPTEATTTTTTARTPTATTPITPTDMSTISTTTAATTGASSPPVPHSPVKLSQQFHISSPDKQRLAMELVCDMNTPQKAPLMRELVKGSSFYAVETLNNQKEKFIHIQQARGEYCLPPRRGIQQGRVQASFQTAAVFGQSKHCADGRQSRWSIFITRRIRISRISISIGSSNNSTINLDSIIVLPHRLEGDSVSTRRAKDESSLARAAHTRDEW